MPSRGGRASESGASRVERAEEERRRGGGRRRGVGGGEDGGKTGSTHLDDVDDLAVEGEHVVARVGERVLLLLDAPLVVVALDEVKAREEAQRESLRT